MRHYLYRHIRLDKNEVFYVGVGTKGKYKFKTVTNEFKRAYSHSTKQRSKWWIRVFNKTEIKVEILFESDDYSFIEQKEIEFIKLYGRQDKGLGTLVNMTDGGVAGLGRYGPLGKLTKKDINNIFQLYNKGKEPKEIALLYNLQYKYIIDILNKIKYFKYSQDLEKINLNRPTKNTIRNGQIKWLSKHKSYLAIGEYFNLSMATISRISKNNSVKEKKCPQLLNLIREKKKHPDEVCVNQYTRQGEFIKRFNNLREAASSVNGSSGVISNTIYGRNKTAYGYIWKH